MFTHRLQTGFQNRLDFQLVSFASFLDVMCVCVTTPCLNALPVIVQEFGHLVHFFLMWFQYSLQPINLDH